MSTSTIEQLIRDAKARRFETSTTEDLLEFCGYLKIQTGDNDNQDKLRQRLMQHLGMTDPSGAPTRNRPTTAVAKTKIRPDYNLSINGKWGGRRHLLKLSPPPGTKLGRAEPIGWNGKATFWLPYNEVHSVPEPIYQILRDRRSRTVLQDRIKQPDGTEEITTKWEFNSIPVEYHGIDPKTKDLAGSITEWYQAWPPSWFKKLNTRELQTVCGLLEVPIKNKNGAIEVSKTDDEMRADIFVFLFGYADVEDAENVKA
jgi:hypothetical protein